MKLRRRILAIMMTIMMLLGTMPTSYAMIGTCPEMGMEHNWVQDSYPPDCYNQGFEGRACNVCSTREGTWTPALGHDWVWTLGYPGDCCSEGIENGECSRCGEITERNNGKYGPHQWWDWETVKEPTCTEDGLEKRECGIAVDYNEDHTETRVIPKLGHDWGEWSVTKASSCTADGEQVHTCKRCGVSETQTIPKLGHDWGEWREVKPATCTEDGKEERVCKRCGATESRPIPKHGHSMGPWYTVREANKDQAGLEERACEYTCGYKEQREIPFKGGDNYIVVRKSVSSTPANGSYYVEGEKITYVITVENRTDGDLENVVYCDPLFGSPDRDYAVAHGGRVEANTDDCVPVGYTVTAEDVANGQIVNQAHVTCYSEYEGRTVTIKSNTVTVPTGEGTLPGGNAPDGSEYDGTAAIDLELENAPASVNAAAGDKVTVQLSLANIGNITLRADAYSMRFANGDSDNFSNFKNLDAGQR